MTTRPHTIRETARGKRLVVGKRETVHSIEKKVPCSTQGHRASATNPMERLR